MYQEEHTFSLRFTLEASFPDDYAGEEDSKVWVEDWEARIKPQMIKSVFASLRRHPGWISHIRSRGASPTNEIEIVLNKDFSQAPPFSL